MIFTLLVIYQIKHFLCDYPLQNKYMLGKFKPGNACVMPLAAHCSVHALATLLIALYFKPDLALWLALLDFSAHFVMDMVKANQKLLGRFKALDASSYKIIAEMATDGTAAGLPLTLSGDSVEQTKSYGRERLRNNTYFWWALGLDQSVHHLTHYLIIYFLL